MIGYINGLTCTWLIKGPDKTTIQVYINSIGLPSSILDNCLHYIEIRDYLSGTKGKLICGNSGGARFIKKNLGPTNMMLVRFDSQYSVIEPGRGFLLTVTAAPSACISSPCKYPATCKDGLHSDEYTCSCTEGYSGTNCDTVASNATVTDSFERDFTTLMRHGTSGVDFKWTTNKYWDLHNFDIAAFDGNLMASLRKYNVGADFTYTGVAKLETSVVFTKANRCLRFNYGLEFNYYGSKFKTTLTVRIFSNSGTLSDVHEFSKDSNTSWTSVEINLPAVNDMKIEFEGRFGVPKLVLDNIRISQLLCCKFLEYSSVNVIIHLRLTHVKIAVLLH
nr:uncharacterized protein LOC117688412 [Crassostrea gigas]